ncbi:MAG: hypothetical protein EKK64_00520 [Neisseriaceae bacterium]|nr:MAG: hypothetical protein EKK64_00520 [Neisseriaceae bacterium]
MNLFEEYLSRHNISNVDLVYHTSSSEYLIFKKKSEEKVDWIILSIDWIAVKEHPGYYEISLCSPIPNSFSKGVKFSRIKSFERKWNEYENFFLFEKEFYNIVKDYDVVSAKDDLFFSLWEMFVVSHDEWFFKQKFDIKELLFKTLDGNKDRKKYIDEMVVFLSANPIVFNSWKGCFLEKFKEIPLWLVKLIEKHRSRQE